MVNKKRFVIVCAAYAAALPAMYVFINPIFATTMGSIMVVSVLLTLWIARNPAQLNEPRPERPLSHREEHLFEVARRAVIVGAAVTLATWAFVASFYWELRTAFLVPGLASCAVTGLAVFGVLRRPGLSGNIMRFQMMLAFGYVLAIPLIVACVLLARVLDLSAMPWILLILPVGLVAGFFVQRWRERSAAVATA